MKEATNILCTRQLSEALTQQAFQNGISLTSHDFIKIEPCAPDTLRPKLQDLAGKRVAAIFTSKNAVLSVMSAIDCSRVKWQFYCISGATRQLISAYVSSPEIAASAPYGHLLAQKIIDNLPRLPLFFFCGNRRLATIPTLLSEANLPCQELTVYHTILTPKKIDRHFEGILFFSPSGVQSFFSINQIDEIPVLFAIGDTTAREIRKYVTNRVIVAIRPDPKLLLQSVYSYFNYNKMFKRWP